MVDGAQKAQPNKIAWAGEFLSAGAIPSEVLRIATGSNEADGSSSFLGFLDKSDGTLGFVLNSTGGSGGKRCPESRQMKSADVNGGLSQVELPPRPGCTKTAPALVE